jgi:hypothetical protein
LCPPDFLPGFSGLHGGRRLPGQEGKGTRQKAGFPFPPGTDGNFFTLGENGFGKLSLDPAEIPPDAECLRKRCRFRSRFQESGTCRRIPAQEEDQKDRQSQGHFHKGLTLFISIRHLSLRHSVNLDRQDISVALPPYGSADVSKKKRFFEAAGKKGTGMEEAFLIPPNRTFWR